MHSKDLTQDNLAKIQAAFPNCITESTDENGNIKLSVDFDLLRQELSDHIVEGPQERYRLDWPGKREAILLANAPIAKTLRPARDESVDFDNTENLFIEGDNLEALKLLQENYLGKVKMIYIDPPYNTGNDFVYQDNFAESSKEYFERSNQVDEEGNRLVANTDSNGRFHSDWLSMMLPRLNLARKLLDDDGVVFISIDDNEASNLKLLCNEIFGEQNLVDVFYLQVRYANKSLNEKDDFQKLIEQVLIYAKDKAQFKPNKPYEDYDLSKFCYRIVELSKGEETVLGGKRVTVFKEGEYEIVKEETGSLDKLKATWASGSVLTGNTSGKFFDQHLANRKEVDGIRCLYKVEGIGEDGLGYRYFTGPKRESATKGQFYSGVPLVRVAELKAGESRKYRPIVNFEDMSGDFGNIRHEGGVDFRSGKKPVKLLTKFINLFTSKDFLVLDFFAGSATTAHATMQLNAEDGGNRKFIMVQLPEEIDEKHEAFKEGYKNIAEISKERIRRAGKQILEGECHQDWNKDVGFRVLKVDTSNMKDVYYRPQDISQEKLFNYVDNIKEDRTSEDLLFQVLLESAVELNVPIRRENIQGKEVYFVNDNDLIACFDNDITEELINELATHQPLRVVFRDGGFADNSVKTNVTQIFKQLSEGTEVRSI